MVVVLPGESKIVAVHVRTHHDIHTHNTHICLIQLKNAEEGKYARLLEAAFTSPDGFVFPTEPVPGAVCSCCSYNKPTMERGSVFGPQEYKRPDIRV